MLQLGFQVPVGAGAKGQARALPLHQKPHRHGLHPPGGEAVGHLFPQQGREAVPHQAIQHPARFLGLHQVLVKVTGMGQRPVDGLPCDLVKHQALHRHLGLEQFQQVPTDGFPFPVFVGGQKEPVGSFEGFFQFLHHLLFFLGHHVQALEPIGGVDPQLCPGFPLMAGGDLAGVVGQVTHMAHGGAHPEAVGQKAADGFGLGGALDDDEGVGHGKGTAAVNRERGVYVDLAQKWRNWKPGEGIGERIEFADRSSRRHSMQGIASGLDLHAAAVLPEGGSAVDHGAVPSGGPGR